MMNLNAYIDHTLLKSTATQSEIIQLCKEAEEYEFKAVCVPPYYVALAKKHCPTSVMVATVIGFPLGYNTVNVKVAEMEQAIKDGADELDMVINLSALFSNDWETLKSEIEGCVAIKKKYQKVLKLIIEAGILSDDQIIQCCEFYSQYEVDFLKTSSGFAEKGASLHAVSLMRQHLPPQIQIKASGGVRDATFVWQLIDEGATRIGTSSGIKIVAKN